ncbi:MAG: NADP-dependent isocitrate dehydrogenase, partial [Clostridia bacterium]|nr:NADP-dependent isocitrate dehydrogenase [Clostridia bacterium]
RGELDGTPELSVFAGRLERACLELIEAGVMTRDIAALCAGASAVSCEEYIKSVKRRLLAYG